MKSFVACVLLLALVNGGLCARKRRQAPAEAAGAGDVPVGPPADVPVVPEVDGLQLAIDSVEAKNDPADAEKLFILKALHAFLEDKKAKGLETAAAPPSPVA